MLGRRDQLDGVLVADELADQKVKPLRPLKPPMPEQLEIVRSDDKGRAFHLRGEPLDLLFAGEKKIARRESGLGKRPRTHIRLFVIGLARDPIVFYSGIDPNPVRMDI